MEGRIRMSSRERQCLGPLKRVVGNEISLATAAQQMDVSYRQAGRLLKRYREEGDAGLVHRACGKPSPRLIDKNFKETVLELVRTKYADFGPTLASEKLAERDGKVVNPETLRRWLIASGDWQPCKRKAKHRNRRNRKPSFGELLQMDGSVHAWFEERGSPCFLMNLVDDATSSAQALFSEQETTWAAMDLLEQWVRRYGIPVALYVDRKSVYVTDREQTPAEQLAAMPALTQFGKACHKLGIRIIEAHSPQAKGRVERKHAVFQDRLIKEMRLEGLSAIETANRFVPGWIDRNNEQFAVSPKSEIDLHRPVPKDLDLRSVFCLEDERSISMDYCIRIKKQWIQVISQKDLPLPRTKVLVQTWRDGSLHILHQGRELACKLLDKAPEKLDTAKPEVGVRQVTIPAPEHPWRKPCKPDVDWVDPRQLPALVNELAETYMGPVLGR